jgi:hypothetical protein
LAIIKEKIIFDINFAGALKLGAKNLILVLLLSIRRIMILIEGFGLKIEERNAQECLEV